MRTCTSAVHKRWARARFSCGRAMKRPLPPALADLGEALAYARGSSRAADRSYSRFSKYLAEAALGTTIEDVFGLSAEPGGQAWWARAPAAEVRCSLVEQLAHHFVGPLTARAKAMAEVAARYSADRYRHLVADHRAETSEDPVKALLWELHRNACAVEAKWPVGWLTLYQILKGRRRHENRCAPGSGSRS